MRLFTCKGFCFPDDMRSFQITNTYTTRESRVVELYFNEVSKYRLLEPDEEAELARRTREGDPAALEKLVKSNLRFVVSVAKKYQHHGLPFSDLIGEGNLALIRAARKFDETKGFKFITFAVWMIRQAMIGAITENNRMIYLPQNKERDLLAIHKGRQELEQLLQREPSDGEVADHLGLSLEDVRDTLYFSSRTQSLEQQLGGDEQSYCLLDVLAADNEPLDRGVTVDSAMGYYRRLAAGLPAEQREIFEMRYGLNGNTEVPVTDITKNLGIGRAKTDMMLGIVRQKLREKTGREDWLL